MDNSHGHKGIMADPLKGTSGQPEQPLEIDEVSADANSSEEKDRQLTARSLPFKPASVADQHIRKPMNALMHHARNKFSHCRGRTGINIFSIKVQANHFHKGHIFSCKGIRHSRRLSSIYYNAHFANEACDCCQGTCAGMAEANKRYLPTPEEAASYYSDAKSYEPTDPSSDEADDAAAFGQGEPDESHQQDGAGNAEFGCTPIQKASVSNSNSVANSNSSLDQAYDWVQELVAGLQFQEYCNRADSQEGQTRLPQNTVRLLTPHKPSIQ